MTENNWSDLIRDLDELLPEFDATLSEAELEAIAKCLTDMEREVDPALEANWDQRLRAIFAAQELGLGTDDFKDGWISQPTGSRREQEDTALKKVLCGYRGDRNDWREALRKFEGDVSLDTTLPSTKRAVDLGSLLALHQAIPILTQTSDLQNLSNTILANITAIRFSLDWTSLQGSGSRLAKADTLQHLFQGQPHLAPLFANTSPGERAKKMDNLQREYKDWVETAQATILARKRLADAFGWFGPVVLLDKFWTSSNLHPDRRSKKFWQVVKLFRDEIRRLGGASLLAEMNLFPRKLWYPGIIPLGDLYSAIAALVNFQCTSRRYYDICAYKALWSAIAQRLWGQSPAEDSRALCLSRLSVLAANPTLLVSQHLSSQYTYSADINYIHSDFEQETLAVLPVTAADVERGYKHAAPFFHAVAEAVDGTRWFWRDTSLHQNIRYVSFYRVGTMPPPFPSKTLPSKVLTVFSGTHNKVNFFRDSLPRYSRALTNLVRATWEETDGNKYDETEIDIQSFILVPHHFRQPPHSQTLAATLAAHESFWAHRLLANPPPGSPRQLFELLGPGGYSGSVLILFHRGHVDPMAGVEEWIGRLSSVGDDSYIGYGFTSEDAAINGWDRSLYGRDNLDYLIAVSLGTLRRVFAALPAFGQNTLAALTHAQIASVPQVPTEEALSLYELVRRTRHTRNTTRNITFNTRVPGYALPPRFCFP
ncbi:hypothetical protein C8R46DRAFT_1211234 [Mycena filopes]|nr:hypothetical protein C8R46DRAFT_1211234 [Mycena filopes]